MISLEQLWKYNNWANERLFNAFRAYGDKVPASGMRLLSHIVNTQSLWLNRVLRVPQTLGVWEEHDLDGCERVHASSSEGIKALVDKSPEELQEKIAYTNTAGITYQNTILDILTHLFNHGSYHRGQIATDLRMKGLEPINTDYINFVR